MEIYSPFILDGATGTELQNRGYNGKECTEKWVLEHPEVVKKMEREYIEAGSQIIYAPTFGANRVKMEENGIFNEVTEYNHRLVEIAKEAAGDSALVAGDISPLGKFLFPLGDMSFEEMVNVYKEQVKAQEEAGVDLFVIETVMTVPEARAALLAVKEVSEKPVLVCFTCDETGQTLMGSDVTALVTIFQGMGADAFGLNCSVGPDKLVDQFRRMRPYAAVPLIAKPNAGMPQIVDGKTVYDCPPEEFTAYLEDLAGAGVAYFGGCCGTGPDHIRMIKEKSGSLRPAKPQPWALSGKLPLATEKRVFPLDPQVCPGKVLAAGSDLSDTLDEELDNDYPVVTIAVNTLEEAENLADCQMNITKPLCLASDNPEALESALRIYQGRAMYDGSLGEEILKPLADKYGLVY